MAFGKESKVFEKLEKTHDRESVLAAWKRYCDHHEGEGQYASGATFSRTFGQWESPNGNRNGKPKTLFGGRPENPGVAGTEDEWVREFEASRAAGGAELA